METKSNVMGKLPPNHWKKGLERDMNDARNIWYEDEKICIITDKYPKSTHHFLVLPKNKELSDLKQLTQDHVHLVNYMLDKANCKVIKEIQKKNDKVEFRCGFHARGSLLRVHMHVISQDFVSDQLKTQKHFNNFNTPYFIDVQTLITCLTEDGHIPSTWENDADKWLDTDIKCHKCHKTFTSKGTKKFGKNLLSNEFKSHLRAHHMV